LQAAGTPLDGLTVILVTVLGIGLMDGVGPLVADDPGLGLTMAIAAFAVNAGGQVIALAVFARVDGAARGSVLVVTGNRNMALVLAAVIDVVTVELRLQVIFAQVPIYLMPLLMRPVYRRLAEGER
jgi:BASS family bile acid:Na+ symporter